MNRRLRTVLIGVGGLFGVALLGVAGIAYSAFAGHTAIEDGAEPAPGVRIVKEGIVALGVVSAGDGKVLLVDTGNDETGAPVLRELGRRKLDSHAVTAIFLTHGHPDHTAGVHLFPSAAVYALADDVALVEGRAGSHGPVTRLFPAKPNGIHVSRALHDGETVDVGSTQVRVFAVPGHTAGSAAFLVNGVLFLGDSAGMNSNGTLAGAPWPATDDTHQNHQSLKGLADRLRPEQVRILVIVPAHTGPGTFDPLAQFVP